MWEEYQVNGTDIWIMKEKLKCLKSELKKWNKEIFGDINTKKQQIITFIRALDLEDENSNLQ